MTFELSYGGVNDTPVREITNRQIVLVGGKRKKKEEEEEGEEGLLSRWHENGVNLLLKRFNQVINNII